MSEPLDEGLDALLRELAPAGEARAALLEEHRQLEKDLLRLADPLPPPELLQRVMARVAEAPARPLTRADAWWAAGIVGSTLALALVLWRSSGGGVGSGGVGLALAAAAVALRDGLVALGGGLRALWVSATLPNVLGLSLLLAASLAALRRLVQPAAMKVVS